MSREYDFQIQGHPSIYTKHRKPRKLNIFFSEPEQGVNKDTGILLLIAGYLHFSQMYLDMRKELSDKHNLIVVQCDYFGWEFMQRFEKETIHPKNETLDYFNDMSVMQALDNISALNAVIQIIWDNGYHFNTKKIVIYGNSHGAYLAHLVNAFMPNVANMIIDNSSYLFPFYLDHDQIQMIDSNNTKKLLKIPAFIKKLKIDRKIIDLTFLYDQFANTSYLVVLQGEKDPIVSYKEKQSFFNKINYCSFILVDKSNIDGHLFDSDYHGVSRDENFLVSRILESSSFGESNELILKSKEYKTDQFIYKFDYTNFLPKLIIKTFCLSSIFNFDWIEEFCLGALSY